MDKEAQYKRLFQLTSIVTDLFPVVGARVLDFSFKSFLGNRILLKSVAWEARRVLGKVKGFNRLLVAADLNIGDAIIATVGVSALREIFPKAEIDYVIKKSARDLVEGNPDVSNLYPIYVGAPLPTESDLSELARLVNSKQYDLVINFSPMIDDKVLGKKNVINYSTMAVQLIRNENSEETVNNVSYQTHRFIGNIFSDFAPSGFDERFRGAHIYLSDNAIESAGSFLSSQGVSLESPIIMFNPDTSARFTRMPFAFQTNLLRRLADLQCTILLGVGRVERFIEHELMCSLSPDGRRKVVVVPEVELDVYAALIDMSDIYITGDTGPLHLAAARKFSRNAPGKSLRNSTAIFSVFGGTPPRIYGYDSKTPGFLAANQDAPSRAFVAKSPCRNITCINKMAKTCREVRCFESLDADEIVSESVSHLETARRIRDREQRRVFAK